MRTKGSRREFLKFTAGAAVGCVGASLVPRCLTAGLPKKVAVADCGDWPFFALCMDVHDTKRRNLAQQAEMLKKLGYSGAGHLWLGKVAERIETLDAAGLTLWQIYMRLNVAEGAKQAYDPKLKNVLPLLRGRPTTLALLVNGGKPGDQTCDVQAVELIREMADQARPFGVKLVLYPHVGHWLEKVSDGVRVAEKVNRPNVGVMFNLCHFLKTNDEKEIRPELEKTGSRLLGVTINGSPTGEQVRAGKGKWIAPLDEGEFDQAGLLRTLKAVGYKGPVGLQCYGLRSDAAEHLARSMASWRKLRAAVARK